MPHVLTLPLAHNHFQANTWHSAEGSGIKTWRDSQCAAKFRAQRDLFLKMATDDQEHPKEISIEFAPDEKLKLVDSLLHISERIKGQPVHEGSSISRTAETKGAPVHRAS
jgi:hypothetical protein